MPLPERVLVDTSAFYALASATDAFHPQARQVYERLIDREQELWTTSYILVEMSALLHRRLGFQVLRTFMDSLQGIVEVFWIEKTIHTEAWKQLVEYQGAGLSLVDWTTVLTAPRLRAHVFTFDHDFVDRGVAVIPR